MFLRCLQWLPSAISAFRIVVGLAFYWLPVDWRLPMAAAAATSDLIDGPLSRWLKADGKFGQLLDPIADKLFLLCVLATLMLETDLAWWEFALVGTRDIAVLLASGVVTWTGGWETWSRMRPRFLGKATTAVQLAFVLVLLWGAIEIARMLMIGAACLGAAAFVDYVIAFRASNEEKEKNKTA